MLHSAVAPQPARTLYRAESSSEQSSAGQRRATHRTHHRKWVWGNAPQSCLKRWTLLAVPTYGHMNSERGRYVIGFALLKHTDIILTLTLYCFHAQRKGPSRWPAGEGILAITWRHPSAPHMHPFGGLVFVEEFFALDLPVHVSAESDGLQRKRDFAGHGQPPCACDQISTGDLAG